MKPGYEPSTGFIGKSNAAKNALVSAYETIFGVGNCLSLLFEDESVVDGSNLVQVMPSRKGITSALPIGAGRASRSTILGRNAAVFNTGLQRNYSIAGGATALSAIAVARWTGTLPFPQYSQLIENPGAMPALTTNQGTSAFLPNGTIYRDGVLLNGVDSAAHAYAVTNGTNGGTSMSLSATNQAFQWVGNVWHVAQFSVTATLAQLAQLQPYLKACYPFLP